ncbi:Nin1 binding protein [Tulasnella sp. 427]|nr:Nin1 binding protein [Tulasnella sp. 427]
MSQSQIPKVDTLVLDAGPLIERKPLRGLANRYVTTPQVVQELKDPRVRQYFEQLSLLEGVNVEVKSPTAVSVSKVIATAKKTGDYSTLSQSDLCVIALTLDCYEISKANTSSAPSATSIEHRNSSDSPQLMTLTRAEEETTQSSSAENAEGGSTSPDQTERAMATLVRELDAACLEGVSPLPSGSPGPSTAVGLTESEASFATASVSTARNDHQEQTLYDDPSSEDDGEGEWITPTNVRKHQERAKNAAVIPAEEEGAVSVASPEAGSAGQDPELVVHLKKNYQWKLRGTNTDLPPPRVGHAKGGGEPTIILREDQKEWERGVRSEALRKKKEEKRIQKALSEKEKRGEDAVWMDADWVPSLLSAGGDSRPGRGLPRIGYKAPKPNRRK